MKHEYVIINIEIIQKRIEELEQVTNLTDREEGFKLGRLKELNRILSESTPLIPVIEKAFEAGRKLTVDGFDEEDWQDYDNYINNLKLDI